MVIFCYMITLRGFTRVDYYRASLYPIFDSPNKLEPRLWAAAAAKIRD